MGSGYDAWLWEESLCSNSMVLDIWKFIESFRFPSAAQKLGCRRLFLAAHPPSSSATSSLGSSASSCSKFGRLSMPRSPMPDSLRSEGAGDVHGMLSIPASGSSPGVNSASISSSLPALVYLSMNPDKWGTLMKPMPELSTAFWGTHDSLQLYVHSQPWTAEGAIWRPAWSAL